MSGKLRNSISWRLVADPQHHEKLNKWLDAQKSNQESITNIVLHMIERFGYKDVTDFQVQRVLFDFASDSVDTSNKELPINTPNKNLTIKEKEYKKDDFSPREEHEDDDDIFNNVDPNSL